MIDGYRRADGGLGARDHVLVLPSVVCSGLTAERIAGDRAIAIPHQHGCAEVGDDVHHTAGVFAGLAANPNVAATLVVGLGCETIQGRALADRIAAAGHVVEYVGIQADGGTERTVDRGRELLDQLVTDGGERAPAQESELVVGLDDASAPFAAALSTLASRTHARVELPPGGNGAQTHADLAASRAQAIVAWCGPGEGPRGFAICPVISVAGDRDLRDALGEDYDVDGTGDPDAAAEQIWRLVLDVFGGTLTAAERRSDRSFSLRRLARTM